MKTLEFLHGPAVGEPHEVEIGRETLLAFWRLGRALESGAPRDREVFTLGRCIGNTAGVTSILTALGEHTDPASFAMSKLIYGGDQPMHDAYWQSADRPVVFELARQVYRALPVVAADRAPGGSDEGGVLIFDLAGGQARLAALRMPERL